MNEPANNCAVVEDMVHGWSPDPHGIGMLQASGTTQAFSLVATMSIHNFGKREESQTDADRIRSK